ncbi:MAG: thiamine phosphate synthase [Proteobacteria bacterium]|nr:thiamine phosphate synthase [Pseudomonadota bacterium]
MTRRHLALPRIWMLTDERQGEALWAALARLPKGAGVIVRHYSLLETKRQALARQIAQRGIFVAYSGSDSAARRAGAKAVYGKAKTPGRLPRLFPVHNCREILAAERAGATLLLLSPTFPTRSHPGAKTLGPLGFARLARTARAPVIALGGMTPKRFKRLKSFGAQGWAAIDAWMESSF